MTPSVDDMARDLAADLAVCEDILKRSDDWIFRGPLTVHLFHGDSDWHIVADDGSIMARVNEDNQYPARELAALFAGAIDIIPAAIRRAIAAEAALAEERQARIDADARYYRAEARCVEGVRLFACDQAERKRLEDRVKELEAELSRRAAAPKPTRVLVNGRDATEDELDRIALSSLARPEMPAHVVEMPAEDVEVRGGMVFPRKGTP